MKFLQLSVCIVLVALATVKADSECNGNSRKRREIIRVCPVWNGTHIIPTDYGCDEFCCGNAVYNKDDGLECCGDDTWGGVFNPSIDSCCTYDFTKSAKVYYNVSSPVNFCCGTDLFTPAHYRTSGCCNGWDQTNNIPAKGGIFNWMTQMCCEGEVSDVGDTAFGSCCGKVGYDRRKDSCPCNNQVLGRGIKHEEARCCESSNEGNSKPYNYKLQSCCNGNVVDNPVDIDSDNLICCDDKIMAVDGQKVCCDGSVEEGDSCCSGKGYDSSEGICCQETLGVGPFTWGSCCGPKPYDAYNSTCCGLDVMPNPIIQIADTLVTSHNTRCCGDFSSPNPVLQPYDYFTSACCNGVVQHFGDLNSFNALCCNSTLLNGTESLCCENQAVAKIYGEETACCGNQPMKPTEECCGGVVMNPAVQICCDNGPRNLGGIPPEKAICCGEGCVDGRDYYCCEGKQVLKTNLNEIDDVDALSNCVTLNIIEVEPDIELEPGIELEPVIDPVTDEIL